MVPRKSPSTVGICLSPLTVEIRRGPSWLAARVRMTKVTETTNMVIAISSESRLDTRSRAAGVTAVEPPEATYIPKFEKRGSGREDPGGQSQRQRTEE